MIKTQNTSLISLTGAYPEVFAFLELRISLMTLVKLGHIPKDLFRNKIFYFLDEPSRVAGRFVCRVFRDLIEQPKLDEEFSQKAARQGYLSLLKWDRANGCPWNESTCAFAVLDGHLEVLQWIRANGCPWDEQTCTFAARGGASRTFAMAKGKWLPFGCMD